MFRVPDEQTLSLCSMFVTFCFSATYFGLWWRNRDEPSWAYWAASGIAYVVGMVSSSIGPHTLSVSGGALPFAAFSAATLLTVAGLRVFAGLRPWKGWMVALLVLPPLLYVVTAIVFTDVRTPVGVPLRQFAGGIALTIVLIACGLALIIGTVARVIQGWPRAVGFAFVAHLPTYLAVLLAAWTPGAYIHDFSHYLRIVQPVLELAIDLMLLAMPGMLAMERLRHAASHDRLTGLYNRHWLGEVEAARAHAGVGIAMIDLDGFKGVNDSCGHAAGDRLLVGFAAHLCAWANTHDAEAVRLGGDEFLLLFPVRGDALLSALRQHIAKTPQDLGDMPPWSASVGISECPAGSLDLETAMQRADAALYSAKKERRAVPLMATETNRVGSPAQAETERPASASS